MKETTFLVLDSELPIRPGEVRQVVLARPQLPLRPFRLRIDPTIAPFFEISEVRVGCHSKMPRGGQSIPASQFMHGIGDGFDLGIAYVAQDVSMYVENTSDRVPGGRGGVPLRFVATWACLVLPMSALRHEDFGAIDPRDLGREDLDSHLDGVRELGKKPIGLTPMPRRQEHPGFGWDPGYDD